MCNLMFYVCVGCASPFVPNTEYMQYVSRTISRHIIALVLFLFDCRQPYARHSDIVIISIYSGLCSMVGSGVVIVCKAYSIWVYENNVLSTESCIRTRPLFHGIANRCSDHNHIAHKKYMKLKIYYTLADR